MSPPPQAYQRNDPRKYSVATVVVRVVAVNHFPPQFSWPEYRGFVIEGDSLASLVNTYGNTVLLIQTQDRDFSDVCTHAHTHTYTQLDMHSIIFCNFNSLFSQSVGHQSQYALLPEVLVQSHTVLPHHTGGASDCQNQSAMAITDTQSEGGL